MEILLSAIIILAVITISRKVMFHLKWKQVYTAFGHKQYYHYVEELNKQGISFRSKTPLGTRRHRDEFPVGDMTQYDIYVLKKDISKISANNN